MSELKTLKDTKGVTEQPRTVIKKQYLREEAQKWIDELERMHREHWKELDEKGYVEMDEPFHWELDGVEFVDYHEQSDVIGAIKILKHFFNIDEKTIEDE